MRIGIINFEVAPAGLNQLFKRLFTTWKKEHTITSIHLKKNAADLQFTELEAEESLNPPFYSEKLIPASSLIMDTEIYQSLDQFDRIIVAGPEKALQLIEKLENKIHNTEFLYIPVSIYNDIPGSELSLGYDTAVNYIVESVLKIQDTIDSLKYPNPRLFGIQLTGKASSTLLEEVAVALGGYSIAGGWKGFEPEKFNNALKNSIETGQTYYFILFDTTVDPEEIPSTVYPSIPVDWKWGQIDEGQCMGPYPTAQDRLLAMQFARETDRWIHDGRQTGRLFIQNRQVLYKSI